MIRVTQLTRWIVIATIPLCLAGCGQNIFKGLAGEPSRTADEQLKQGNFQAAIDQADQLISNGVSGEALQEAYSTKGAAILAQNKNLPYNGIQKIIDLSKDPSANIVDTLDGVSSISPSAAAEAADCLNIADALGTSGDIQTSSIANPVLSPSLNSTAQLNRAFANGTVVVKMLTRYLDISVDGSDLSVTRNSLSIESSLSIENIISYLYSPPKTVQYYATNAVDAAVKGNILTNDQTTVLRRLKIIGVNMAQLKAIVDNNNAGSFRLKDENGDDVTDASTITFNSGVDGTQDSKYIDALQQILAIINTGDL
jgi:hypothetical protein